MASFTHLDTIFTANDDGLLGALAIERFLWGGVPYLLVGGGALGVLTLYRDDNGSLSVVDQLDIDQVNGMTRFVDVVVSGADATQADLFLLGEGGDSFNVVQISDTGFDIQESPSIQNTAAPDVLVQVDLGSDIYLVHNGISGAGLTVTEVVSDGYVEVTAIPDSGSLPLGDTSAVAQLDVTGTTFVIAASAFDTGVALFELTTDGGLTLSDTVLPEDGSGFWLPQDLVALEFGGKDFVVMASSGTSSLTAFSVSSDGTIVETDHILDSLDTRFEGASVLEGFVYADQGFVVAAGHDDGFSMLRLDGQGQFEVVLTIEDQFEFALENISDMDVDLNGDLLTLWIVSESEHGATGFEIDMGSVLHDPRNWVCLDFPQEQGSELFGIDALIF